MDYLALKNEINTDPTGKGYLAHLPHSPGLVVDKLNARTEMMIKERFVTARTVLAECGANSAIILDKLDAATAQISAVKWAMSFLKKESGLDVGHPGTQLMLDQLAAGGVLTVEEASILKNLALQPASRAEVLGLNSVTEADIRIALGA